MGYIEHRVAIVGRYRINNGYSDDVVRNDRPPFFSLS